MSKFFIFLLLLLPSVCMAQFTISGRVLNDDTNKPVAAASVFIGNATIGSESSNNGTFNLYGVKPGKYTLVISVVGYKTFSQAVMVANSDVKLGDVIIQPKNTTLKEVIIRPDPLRDQYLYQFEQQFLGKSELAKECKILNPAVIDLHYDTDNKMLTATSSSSFIEIENAGLGYKVKYLLFDFALGGKDTLNQIMHYEGVALYEPMKGTPADQQRWAKRREEAYGNSAMHFFRAAVASRLDEEGFKVTQLNIYRNPDRPSDSLINAKIAFYKKLKATNPIYKDTVSYWENKLDLPTIYRKMQPFPLDKGDLIRPTDQRGLYALGCDFDGLFVVYNKQRNYPSLKFAHLQNPHNTECTLVGFNSPFAIIDRNGAISNPYSITYEGVWKNNRVAELLPLDYEPGEEKAEMSVDSTVVKNITARLDSFTTRHPVEKAYLHFDKPYYAAGDTMYFKAYLTTGGLHELSGISGMLHVDLINDNDRIVKTENLLVNNGVTWGDFVLPDSAQKGNYRVRAYTQWMRNNGAPDFFMQTIPVGAGIANKKDELPFNAPVAAGKPDVQFFPEGGTLITGIKSKVAFKAIGYNGLGIPIKGVVIDNDNQPVGTFTAAHLGMGAFNFTPAEGKTYKAKVTYAGGTTGQFDLPASTHQGITLSVDNDSTTKALVSITADKNTYRQNLGKNYTLTVYAGGKLTSYICKMDTPVIAFDLHKRELPSGIARVTVFSPTGEPLAERLLFIQNYDGLKLGLTSDKTSYAKREKVSINLNAINADGEPVQGQFSVSVTDESKVPVNADEENTIVNNLLLTSDLKGYVEQPNYYFGTDEAAAKNLDILLLTQGYRDFSWKQILADTSTQVKYKAEGLFQLSGTLTSISGKPAPHGSITLLVTKQGLAKDTITDKNGRFTFDSLYFADSTKLVLRARKENNGSAVTIKVDKPDYPTVTEAKDAAGAADIITPETKALLQKQFAQNQDFAKNGIILKQVNIKSYNTKAYLSPNHRNLTHSTNLNGAGAADYIFMGDDLVGCPNFLDCLIGKIPGTRLQAGLLYSARTHIEITGATPAMAIIYDGIVMDQTPNSFEMINPTDIYSIEVLEDPSYLQIYGSRANGGAIIITSKHGGDYNYTAQVVPGVVTYQVNGFYKGREFYSPKYGATMPVNNKPDLRTTIYWKPQLITDEKGNASFNFYNADGQGSYRVVVEGLDVKGNIGRHVYHYKVE